MAKLTAEMKELVATQQCWVATVGADGAPNVGPKRSTRVLDDEHLAFNEGTAKQTWENVQRGSKVAIGVADREKLRGFRFVGQPEIVTEGSLYDGAAKMAKERGLPAPKAVVKVTVERIFDLSVPGAGREIV
jgi:hypothetical protein